MAETNLSSISISNISFGVADIAIRWLYFWYAAEQPEIRNNDKINNTGKIILQDHIEHCIVDAVEHGDKDAIKELEIAIDRFMK